MTRNAGKKQEQVGRSELIHPDPNCECDECYFVRLANSAVDDCDEFDLNWLTIF